MLTALGFPYFARFVPEGEAGRYSGLFFAGRAVAAGAALPLAGLAVELSGSYRAVLWLGAASPRGGRAARGCAERRAPRARGRASGRAACRVSVAAVIPVFASDRAVEVARSALRHVDELVLVEDGRPVRDLAVARRAGRRRARARSFGSGSNGGKGSAVAAGAQPSSSRRPTPPEAIVVLDSDGQHEPERIPAFVEAARHADVVIGDRRDRRTMPLSGGSATAPQASRCSRPPAPGCPTRRTACACSGATALRERAPPRRRLRSREPPPALAAQARATVASVEIPTIYDGEPSHFRPVRDTTRVARALVGPRRASEALERGGRAADARAVLRALGAAARGALCSPQSRWALAMPVFQPLDNALYLADQRAGRRTGVALRRARPAHAQLHHPARHHGDRRRRRPPAAALRARSRARPSCSARISAGAAIEVVKLFVDRARPEEVLGAQAQLSHGRSWGASRLLPLRAT